LNILAELTNITALTCFALMALGVIRLRKMLGPPKKDEFKVPLVPLLPILSILSCIFLMLQVDKITWTVFIISLILGLAIYFGYGYQHSDLNEKKS